MRYSVTVHACRRLCLYRLEGVQDRVEQRTDGTAASTDTETWLPMTEWPSGDENIGDEILVLVDRNVP